MLVRLVIGVVMMALLPVAANAQGIRVTLLGTGTPVPAMNRVGPSILVEAGGQKFLFDAGRGAMQRLAQLKVRWQDVDGVFLTHLHSDHVVGFPDLWLTGWKKPTTSTSESVCTTTGRRPTASCSSSGTSTRGSRSREMG